MHAFLFRLFPGYFFIFFILLSACKKDTVVTYYQSEYFPLKTGMYYIYNVDSIRFHNVPFSVKKPDSIHFQIKDTVISSFIYLTGLKAFRIDEFRRFKVTDGWEFLKTFIRTENNSEAIESDGNFRYVKLMLPVYSNRSWNANKYNSEDTLHALKSVYEAINQSWSSNGLTYDSTVLVKLQNDTNLINSYVYYERYAANIGLIMRHRDSVFINETIPNDPKATLEGYKRLQTLSNYGPR